MVILLQLLWIPFAWPIIMDAVPPIRWNTKVDVVSKDWAFRCSDDKKPIREDRAINLNYRL